MDKVKIEFLKSVTVQNNSGRHYDKGCVVELSQDSARHWLKRNVARIVGSHVEPVKEDAPVVEAEEEAAESEHEEENSKRGRKRKG